MNYGDFAPPALMSAKRPSLAVAAQRSFAATLTINSRNMGCGGMLLRKPPTLRKQMMRSLSGRHQILLELVEQFEVISGAREEVATDVERRLVVFLFKDRHAPIIACSVIGYRGVKADIHLRELLSQNKKPPPWGRGRGRRSRTALGGRYAAKANPSLSAERHLIAALRRGYNPDRQGWFQPMSDDLNQASAPPRREDFCAASQPHLSWWRPLGPLPLEAKARMRGAVSREWGEMLVRGWTEAGRINPPNRVGDNIAPLIGQRAARSFPASQHCEFFQLSSEALEVRPERRMLLSGTGNVPSDRLYRAGALGKNGLCRAIRIGGAAMSLVVAPWATGSCMR